MSDSKKLMRPLHPSLQKLIKNLEEDPVVTRALKGHLVIEEMLTGAIEGFVSHARYIELMRLSFPNKVLLCRSMSVADHDSVVWDLIQKLNEFRNALAHYLDDARRARKLEELRQTFDKVVGGLPLAEFKNDSDFIVGVVSLCVGFLSGIQKRIEHLMSDQNKSKEHA